MPVYSYKKLIYIKAIKEKGMMQDVPMNVNQTDLAGQFLIKLQRES